MAKRSFRAEDALRLRTASDPDLSPDGRRVAFAVVAANEQEDKLCASIWVAALDGSSPPRRFTDGPADKSPRWSPDGRWLAYLSITDDQPDHAHVRLAPLDGGVPARLGDLPGPVSQLAWSPDSNADRRRLPRRGSRSREGQRDGAQRAARRARARGAPRRGRLAGRPAPSVRRRCGGRIDPAADPGRIRQRRPVVLPRRRARSCSRRTAIRAAMIASSAGMSGSYPIPAAGRAA